MRKLFLFWVINAIAIGVAVYVVPGIHVGAGPNIDLLTLFPVALIFGLVNALVRPVLKLLSCGLVVMTLGLFIFVINTAMLFLTAAIAGSLGFTFQIDGIVAALLASVLISIVSMVLSILIPED